MTKNMTKGLKYGVVVVLILTGLFTYSVVLGLIALAIAGGVLWKMQINPDMDADLRATTKEIVEAVDPVPETPEKLPFIENEGTDPFMAGQAAIRNLGESLAGGDDCQKEHIFSAADNQSK